MRSALAVAMALAMAGCAAVTGPDARDGGAACADAPWTCAPCANAHDCAARCSIDPVRNVWVCNEADGG